ncbi:MAG: redoxin family protein, partial [Pirellulaceae bacterium]
NDNGPLPDLHMYPVPTLQGIVRDSDGHAVPGAYVRMRHSGYGDTDPIGDSAADGSFSLTPTRLPYSADGKLGSRVFVVAMDARRGLGGICPVDLKNPAEVRDIDVRLEPRLPSWFLDVVPHFESTDAATQAARRDTANRRAESFPRAREGSPVPSMREGTWLNTTATSLEDFRGKMVLLDFWFIGCGPCHRDMPTVQAAHRHFAELGFTVVGVHVQGETPDSVQRFAAENHMTYPIVVDNLEGTIAEQFRQVGVTSYPTYILLDRAGRILHHDLVSPGAKLRNYKMERIYQALTRSPASR